MLNCSLYVQLLRSFKWHKNSAQGAKDWCRAQSSSWNWPLIDYLYLFDGAIDSRLIVIRRYCDVSFSDVCRCRFRWRHVIIKPTFSTSAMSLLLRRSLLFFISMVNDSGRVIFTTAMNITHVGRCENDTTGTQSLLNEINIQLTDIFQLTVK